MTRGLPDPRALVLSAALAPEEARAILEAHGFRDPERADKALARLAATPDDRLALADLLPPLLHALARAGSPDRGLHNVARLLESLGALHPTVRLWLAEPPVLERAATLCAQSQYFADLLIREPRLLEWLGTQARPPTRAALREEARAALGAVREERHKITALHRLKRRELLACAFRDHVLGHPLGEIAAEISTIAEVVIESALEVALFSAPRAGAPLAVIALGKLGGGELNYSSDVDLLFVHGDPPPGDPDPQSTFDRVAREVVRLLSSFGEEGALYRVDLRLRPEGALGALTRGIPGYARYYATYGRTWERQALLKARPVAGDLELGRRFVEAVEPFVFRRYLEVAAIGEIKALKRRLEERGAARPTRDVKEGPGGIRDIEFVVQFLTLENGGELPEVRDPSTLGAIEKLERARCLEPAEAAALRDAYAFLRTVEHRLQTLYSLQTHALPEGEEEERDLARRLGYAGTDARERFLEDLERKGRGAREVLDRLLHGLFPEAAEAGAAEAAELVLDPDPAPEKVARVLSGLGFRDPPRVLADLRRMATERSRFLAPSPRARTYLASLAPSLLRAVAARPDPDETLSRLERAVATLGGKSVFYELLIEHEGTLELFVRLVSESRFLTDLLVGNPGAFDELVDLLLTDEPVDVPRVLARMTARPGEGLAAIRPVFVSTMLLTGVRDLGERWNVANVLEALSALAEATLRAVAPAEEGLSLLALGKLGGREIGYASDLDVVLVHDLDLDVAAQRAHAFVRDTEALGLYALDFRLRPDGSAGPLATSFDALERYYASGRAAGWERLAATKLRAVALDLELASRRLPRILSAVYAGPSEGLAAEALEMRGRLERSSSGAFDLKRGPGGLVDIELATALLRLRARGEPAGVREPGTVPALHALARAGILERGAYTDLLTGYQFLRKLESRLRVAEGRAVSSVPEDPAERRAFARRLGYVDTRRRHAEDALVDELRYHQETVRKWWLEIARG